MVPKSLKVCLGFSVPKLIQWVNGFGASAIMSGRFSVCGAVFVGNWLTLIQIETVFWKRHKFIFAFFILFWEIIYCKDNFLFFNSHIFQIYMRSQDDSTNWSEPQKSNCLSTLKQTIYKEMIFYLFLGTYGFNRTIPNRVQTTVSCLPISWSTDWPGIHGIWTTVEIKM